MSQTGEKAGPGVLAHAEAGVDLAALAVPPVVRWLAAAGNLEEREMLRIFNCGAGMIVVAEKNVADTVAVALTAAGEAPFRIGEIIGGEGAPRLVFEGRLDL